MDLWKIHCISFLCRFRQLPPLAPNIFFCCSDHQGTVFFFFLLLSLPSSVLQWHHVEGNFFLGCGQANKSLSTVQMQCGGSISSLIHYHFAILLQWVKQRYIDQDSALPNSNPRNKSKLSITVRDQSRALRVRGSDSSPQRRTLFKY